MDKQAQMTLNFEPGLSTRFPTIRRYIDERIGKGPKAKEYVAADMELSPSDLTRKLNQNPNDKRTFGTDDLCRYMETQNDFTPILWLIDRYGQHLKVLQDKELRSEIERLQQLLQANDSGSFRPLKPVA